MRLPRIKALIIALALIGCSDYSEKTPPLQVRSTSTTGQWRSSYPPCPGQKPSNDTDKRKLQLPSCLTDDVFHIDGPQLLQTVTEYVCAPSNIRDSFFFTVNPPNLASTLNAIASKKLKEQDMPEKDRSYVQPIVHEYAKAIQHGSEMYLLLLRNVVLVLEKEDEAGVTHHLGSEKARQHVVVPADCKLGKPDAGTKGVVAIVNETIQRFSQLHWHRVTNLIARANKVADIDAAQLIIPKFILSTNAVDLVSRIYGASAPGNGSYPNSFSDIDIMTSDSKHSRFAVPVKELPVPAARFLESQSDGIYRQMGEITGRIKDKSSVAIISVSKPDSVRVFSNIFWAEHIFWQIAFRELLLNEDITLDPSQYQTYGLH